MSLAVMIWARDEPTDLSPIGRFALLAHGDSASDDGFVLVSPAIVRLWASRPLNECQQGLDEIEAKGLLYRLGGLMGTEGTEHGVLAVPGWEKVYDRLVRHVTRKHSRRQPIPASVYMKVLMRDGRVCQRCGSTDRPTVDHKIPVARGGTNIPENLRVLCQRCNSRKGDRLEVIA